MKQRDIRCEREREKIRTVILNEFCTGAATSPEAVPTNEIWTSLAATVLDKRSSVRDCAVTI